MRPDPEHLRRYYANLSDDALLALGGDDMVAEARAIYDAELASRDLAAAPLEDDEPFDEPSFEEEGEEPDWVETAGCVCSYTATPHGRAATDAEQARQVLFEAGIPCRVVSRQHEEPATEATTSLVYEVMVPGKHLFEATSELDRGLFNEDLEERWRTHLENLDNADFADIDLDSLLSGYIDRVERLKRVYQAEADRRKRKR